MIVPFPDYTHLGHDYLEKVNAYQWHSGVDLNYGKPNDDLNKPVKAMAAGQVVFSLDTGKGWGNLIVVYHPAYGCWSRYAHLSERRVLKGQKVKEGQEIGLCGRSGGNWSPHLHWDVIVKELKRWTQYTSFWTIKKIKEHYANPLTYVAETNLLEKKEDEPIVKWHKENKIIENWDSPPTPAEIKLGWSLYKALKAASKKKLKFNLK